MPVIKIFSVVGARPQFIKLAPVHREIKRHDRLQHTIVHTGQHYDTKMSDIFFDQLELPRPDLNLRIGSDSHAKQTAAMMIALERLLLDEKPDGVLVYGDTNSTLAATLAAVKLHTPVLHVEAGLRSYNKAMPEEINRLIADHCSDRLYAPTPQAMRNLESENLLERSMLSGDVMRDAIEYFGQRAMEESAAVDSLDLASGAFGVVTLHRPVNTQTEQMTKILEALRRASTQMPLVFPVHPRTRKVLNEIGVVVNERIRLVEPQSYLDMIALISAAAVVVTDSGGVQKEAAFLHTPCVTVREETEWSETTELGVNKLVGNDPNELSLALEELSQSGDRFDASTLSKLDEHFGRGDSAKRIIEDCVAWLA